MIKINVGHEYDDSKGKTGSSQTFFMHEDLIASRSSFIKNALNASIPTKHRDDSPADKTSQAPVVDQDESTWIDCEATDINSQDDTETPDTQSTPKALDVAKGSCDLAEKDSGAVELPEDDPKVFGNYVQLLYSGVLPIHEHPETTGTSESIEAKEKTDKDLKSAVLSAVDKEYKMLGNLYVFAEKLGDLKAKCSILSATIEATQKKRADGLRYFPCSTVIKDIYAGTKPADRMRKFLTNVALLMWHEGWGEEAKHTQYHYEYLFDVVVAMGKGRAVPTDELTLQSIEHATPYCDELEALARKEEDIKKSLE